MSQLTRAAMKWSRLIETAQLNRRLPSTFFISSKPFSTGAAEPSRASGDQFLETPSSGLVYGKLTNITKHTMKSDIINLLQDSNLNPKNLKVEYDRSYAPTSMMVEFPSQSAYAAALKSITRKGRLFNLFRSDKSQWNITSPYDGKAILLQGIPRDAFLYHVERFLSGCQYDASTIQMFVRSTNQGSTKMAVVRFPSRALAMHAFITKNRGFVLNNQITVQVLH